ncbi:carbamate kinase [Halospeciosus flavus]|uniref:Carbamate kinase n=1 Tax=Halospeciosus flavus TaxID=3032283 RepID=A0ABD5Z487_9EURY|nr:carbamate kinase [Halospeciosus flavus]
MRTVVALGGNALLPPDGETADDQWRRVRETADRLAALRERGRSLVCTHGNGPQVGNRLLEQEHTDTPDFSLDVLGAETQAQIGYQLQQALDDATDVTANAVTVVTQTRVDPDDPRMDEPSKPVGPRYTAEEAATKPFATTEVETESGETAYRRVVPSPKPIEILEADHIAALVHEDTTVVCGGGGGVPVVEENGELRGVEAVVDKDYTSRLVAERTDADDLLFLTDVDYAYRNFGEPDEEPIEEATPDELRDLLDAGEFGEGSMRPKIETCIEFVEGTGAHAIITTPENVERALDGETGTHVHRG